LGKLSGMLGIVFALFESSPDIADIVEKITDRILNAIKDIRKDIQNIKDSVKMVGNDVKLFQHEVEIRTKYVLFKNGDKQVRAEILDTVWIENSITAFVLCFQGTGAFCSEKLLNTFVKANDYDYRPLVEFVVRLTDVVMMADELQNWKVATKRSGTWKLENTGLHLANAFEEAVQLIYSNTITQAKEEINNLATKDKGNQEQAVQFGNHLMEKYPWMCWNAVVYNEIAGFDNHCTRGQYFHFFRHQSKNIVIQYALQEGHKRDSRTVDESRMYGITRTKCNILDSLKEFDSLASLATRRAIDLYYSGNCSPKVIVAGDYNYISLKGRTGEIPTTPLVPPVMTEMFDAKGYRMKYEL